MMDRPLRQRIHLNRLSQKLGPPLVFAADGAKAMAEYLAEPEAIRVRTAHLKTLRLERAAVEAAEKQKAVAIKKKIITKKVMKPRKRVLSPSHLPH
jgi:hypothetical protein